MRDEYDFSKARKNSYAKKIKKQVTIRLEPEVIDYFKGLAQDNGIPYQTLINLFLRNALSLVRSHRSSGLRRHRSCNLSVIAPDELPRSPALLTQTWEPLLQVDLMGMVHNESPHRRALSTHVVF